MKDYGQIIGKLRSSPWLITEESLKTILDIADRRLNGEVLNENEMRLRIAGNQHSNGDAPKQASGVAVLPLTGPIFPRANMMTELSGATSLEEWTRDLRALATNDRVTGILLDIDSPGGVSDLVEETGAEIRRAAETKPVYAIANTMAASAAYWLASQAGKLYQTPSGVSGSVGVYSVHTDDSRRLEALGFDRTVFSVGRFKASGLKPVTADTREYYEAQVLECYDAFVESVAEGRGTTTADVIANYGEGGVVGAKKALEAGMIDGIATFDEVLSEMVATPTASLSIRARASIDKELEHSEPGTGSPPEPRQPPEDEDEDKWENGERLPDPEEFFMNREQMEALATKLGITHADVSDENLETTLLEALNTAVDEAVEIRKAAANANQRLAFEQEYPQQAAQLRKLEAESQRSEAIAFANNLTDFKVTVNGKELNYRLSTLAQDAVKDVHLKLAERSLVADDVANLVRVVSQGTVPQGEIGSTRSQEVAAPGGNRVEDRKAFAALVEELMTNDGLDRKSAIAEAGKRNPALASAYLYS